MARTLRLAAAAVLLALALAACPRTDTTGSTAPHPPTQTPGPMAPEGAPTWP